MDPALSASAASTGAIVLLTVAFIAYGGTFVLRVARGGVKANDLQQKFYRAGHAHAGVLVTLGLVVNLYVDLAGVDGTFNALSAGVLFSAILIPAGFFLSVLGTDPERPNRLVVLLWLGVGSLVVGVISAAIGLLTI